MAVGKQRTRLYRLFHSVVMGAVFCVCACAFPATLFAADGTTQKTVEAAVEKAAQKVVEKAAAVAVEKAELTANRPDEWRGPTKANFLIFVVDIDGIDDANESIDTNVYLRLRWKDKRLANPGASTRQVPLEEIWNPRVLIANQQGRISKSLPDVAQVDPDGTVIYHQRYTGSCRNPWTCPGSRWIHTAF